jgi:hypothetical protein
VDTLTIDAAVVSAVGGEGSAGIGAGYGWEGLSSVCEILISFATITAIGGANGAGIGAGQGEYGTSAVGKLVIANGTVSATGGWYGAGVGTALGLSGNSSIDTIVITGCRLRAFGLHAAGIGAGYGHFGDSTVGSLTIEDALVTAGAGDGAAIGAGWADYGVSSVEALVLNRVSANATCSSRGAGIGSGFGSHGLSIVSEITILNCAIAASGASGGAGIGSGNGWFGISSVGYLLIGRGEYSARGEAAGGIGAGDQNVGQSTVEILTIRQGSFRTSGVVGLGAGPGGDVHRVELVGAVRLECEAESVTCLNGSEIVASDAEVDAVTNTPRFVDGAPFGPAREQELRLFGRYRVRSKPDSFGDVVVIHFGEIIGITGEQTLIFRHNTSGYTRAVRVEGNDTVGVILSLEQQGVYLVNVVEGGHEVALCQDAKTDRRFAVGAGESFYAVAGVCGASPDANGERAITVWIALGCVLAMGVTVAVGVFFWRRRMEASEQSRILRDDGDVSYRTSEA